MKQSLDKIFYSQLFVCN